MDLVPYGGSVEHRVELNAVSDMIGAIRDTITRANVAETRGEDAGWLIESAFVQTRIILEAVGLMHALDTLQNEETLARKNYSETKFSDELQESFLVWGSYLWDYTRAVEIAFGEAKLATVTKDVTEILRATQYSITDPACFPSPPKDEADVHVRIEAVLRCVFPDLVNKPPIVKHIKHFIPDTGIPSIRTLIEYKFIASNADTKRIADEILADTRGYFSKEWDQCIYVIYETKRLKSEKQWIQLFKTSGIPASTKVIVLNGEMPDKTVTAKVKAKLPQLS